MTGDEQHLLDTTDDASTPALLRELIRIPGQNPLGQEPAKAWHLAGYLAPSGISTRPARWHRDARTGSPSSYPPPGQRHQLIDQHPPAGRVHAVASGHRIIGRPHNPA